MLSLLGIFAIIFISVLTFRTARDYGKNALLWTFAALAVGFGIQIIIPIIAVIIAAATGKLSTAKRTVVALLSGHRLYGKRNNRRTDRSASGLEIARRRNIYVAAAANQI